MERPRSSEQEGEEREEEREREREREGEGEGEGEGVGKGEEREGEAWVAVVIGGSIAGLSCAHALLRDVGCPSVIVLEKARCMTPAGAGLGLDPDACSILDHWGLSQVLFQHSLPLSSEENRAIERHGKGVCVLARDDSYDHRSVHWSDLHRILYESLPTGTVHWGHEVISFQEQDNGSRVVLQVKVLETGITSEFVADLLVAADGSMSNTRKHFVPNEIRRYCGYCAWRGVLDSSSGEGAEIRRSLMKHYPNLGYCLHFDIAEGTHAVLYELHGHRLNWLWYVNQPEPPLQGASVTAKGDKKEIEKMHVHAGEVWIPELARLMKATPAPFVNAIFDREPLQKLAWGRIVLVGEAAHPTSPHGLRSTNMSISDAFSLGQCLIKQGHNIPAALCEFELLRLHATTKDVLFSRHMGQLKQGFLNGSIDIDNYDHNQLLQRNRTTFLFQ